MRVALGLNEVLVHVDYESLNYKIIMQYVDKNFSNTLKFTSTVLIFNNEQEKYKKQFFLQWLYASYKKVNPDLMPSFKTNLLKRMQHPIKIRIVNKKEIQSSFNISIKHLRDEQVACRLDVKNYLMINYLKLTFRKELLKKSKDGMAISLNLSSSTAKEKLANLLKRRKILNYSIAFVYDELWMNEFLHPGASESARYGIQVYRDDFVTSSYELLKSSPVDTMDVIKKRYIKLVKKFHPDRIYSLDHSRVAEFTEKFQMVQRAYEAIKKDKKNKFSLAS